MIVPFRLFIGDIFQELADAAKAYDSSAELLTSDNLPSDLSSLHGTYYTSLADIGSSHRFSQLCLAAEEIHYHPPKKWSDKDQQRWTETVLWNATQYTSVHGLSLDKKEQLFINLSTPRARISDVDIQLWTAGCSYTAGVGVNYNEAWPFVVSEKLKIPYANTARPASSIIWASYQICQLPIIPGDLVFWGLTSQHRVPLINDDETGILHYITTKHNRKIPIELLDGPSLFYHNLMAIKNAHNFCEKSGAKLVILGLIYDWDSFFKTYQIKNFRQYAVWPYEPMDLGTDNLHPGPKEHQAMAESFIEFYHQLYKV